MLESCIYFKCKKILLTLFLEEKKYFLLRPVTYWFENQTSKTLMDFNGLIIFIRLEN